MKSIDYRLHKLSNTHITDLIALSDSVGWDYDEAEVRTILSIGTVFGHKDRSENLLSCAAIIPYEDKLASIGMVIVHPSARGMGLGRELMKECMAAVPSDTTIMLIATPEGEPLYNSLGFQTVSRIRKFIAESFTPEMSAPQEAANDFEISPMQPTDFASIVKLDETALGSRRTHFLEARMHQATVCVVAKNRAGLIVGYGFAVQGPVNLITGPIVARDADMATRILCRLTHGHTSRVRIDVPDHQIAFHSFLEKSGFRQVSHPPVMVANADSLPPRDGTYWAIGAQIYG